MLWAYGAAVRDARPGRRRRLAQLPVPGRAPRRPRSRPTRSCCAISAASIANAWRRCAMRCPASTIRRSPPAFAIAACCSSTMRSRAARRAATRRVTPSAEHLIAFLAGRHARARRRRRANGRRPTKRRTEAPATRRRCQPPTRDAPLDRESRPSVRSVASGAAHVSRCARRAPARGPARQAFDEAIARGASTLQRAPRPIRRARLRTQPRDAARPRGAQRPVAIADALHAAGDAHARCCAPAAPVHREYIASAAMVFASVTPPSSIAA